MPIVYAALAGLAVGGAGGFIFGVETKKVAGYAAIAGGAYLVWRYAK